MKTLKQHLKLRHLDTRLHGVWIDEFERVATFPLWNLSGQLSGFQQYRPGSSKDKKNDITGRYYTFRGDKLLPRKCKTVSVWGLESWHLSDVLFVTEGVFDAARLTESGISAVALLANNPCIDTRNWLEIVGRNRKVVSVCDSDSAGRYLATVSPYTHKVEEFNDLGDASDEYVQDLVCKFC